MKLQRIIKFC